jgi:hypothetical protein
VNCGRFKEDGSGDFDLTRTEDFCQDRSSMVTPKDVLRMSFRLNQAITSLKIVIADAGNGIYDSAVLHKGNGCCGCLLTKRWPWLVPTKVKKVKTKTKTKTMPSSISARLRVLSSLPLAVPTPLPKRRRIRKSSTQAQRRDLPNSLVIGLSPGPINTGKAKLGNGRRIPREVILPQDKIDNTKDIYLYRIKKLEI